MNGNGSKEPAVVRFVLSLVSVAIAALVTVVIQHQARLRSIEDTRFTREDGQKLVTAITEAKNHTPDWFKTESAHVREALKDIEQRMRSLESK